MPRRKAVTTMDTTTAEEDVKSTTEKIKKMSFSTLFGGGGGTRVVGATGEDTIMRLHKGKRTTTPKKHGLTESRLS